MLKTVQHRHGFSCTGARVAGIERRHTSIRVVGKSAPEAEVKAVIFDLGKVLLDFDFRRAATALAALDAGAGVSTELLLEVFGHGPTPPSQPSLVEQYERGLLDTPAFYEAVTRASGLRCSLENFSDIYGDIFTPIAPLIAQQQLLRRARVPTYILSNTSELHVRHVRATYPFFSGFDGYVTSHEVRSYKPEEGIYRAAERAAGLTGGELCFIDDKLENVEAAHALGWRCIHHISVASSLQEMAALGLPVVEEQS